MSKYGYLTNYLICNKNDKIKLSFSEMEEIIGCKLPDTSYTRPQMWYGNPLNTIQVFKQAWGKAGYAVETVNLQEKFVVLSRSKFEFFVNKSTQTKEMNNVIENKKYNRKVKVIIPTPTEQQVEYYLDKWNSLENYVLQEKSLDKLFLNIMTKNDNIEDILIKCSTLNDFYSTNIFSIYPVAKHILNLRIDDRLKNNDDTLVDDISLITYNGKTKYFYSFATKYCSHHNPLNYPIYDDYVCKILIYFKNKDNFYAFKKEDLKNYKKFKNVLFKFRSYYHLDKYNLKELDKYLWQVGKEYFNKYNK